jgi:hypothetical protein
MYKCSDSPSFFLEEVRMRFKDDPHAETFFQPRKGAGQISQQATPLADQGST